jgi:2-methylcitrate dehydratase PrpD
MPFCAAAAVVHGRVGIDTFEPAALNDPAVRQLMPRVTLRVDPAFDGAAPPLTQSRVTVRLRDGRTLTHMARGARGYPDQPASDDELATKFRACARRTLSETATERALAALTNLETAPDLGGVTELLASDR